MKKIKLVLAILFLLSLRASAQSFEPIGPWGGRANAFTRTANGTIYAATLNSGFFKSLDNGNTWREANIGITAQTSFTIASVGDTVYGAPFGDGIYKTTNGGLIWTADTAGGLGSTSIYAIYADASGNLYAGGTNTGLFYKPLGASVWQNISGNLPPGNSGNRKTIRGIFKDSNNNLHIGTEGGVAPDGGGLYTSSDNGATWTRNSTNLGTTTPSVRSFAQRGDTLFVGVFSSGAGVYRKTLSETSWTIDTVGLGARAVNALYLAPNGTLYAGINPTNPGGVFSKPAGASSWSQVALAGRLVAGFLQVGSEVLIGSDVFAVSRTTNFTTTTPSNTGIGALDIASLFVASNGNIYAGIDNSGGIYKSVDNGATWQIDTLGLGARTVLDIEELNGTPYITASALGVYRWSGSQWVAANTGIQTRTVQDILVYGDTLIVGLTSSSSNPVIYRSENGGSSWTAATISGVASLGTVRSLAKDNAGNLYAGMSSTTTVPRGLLKSTDGGRSWSPSNGAMSILNQEFYAMAFNIFNNTLYAAPNVSSIYASTDRGATWASDSTGIENASVDDFLIPVTLPPNLNGSIIAACLGQSTEGGVFLKLRNSPTWQRLGLTLYSATSLAEKSGNLYVGTGHNSVYRASFVAIGLPVELTQFGARKVESGIELFWKTATELNNAGFHIERRATALQNASWETLGFIEGYGTTAEAKSYSFLDKTSSGKSQYRLKQVDFDGRFEYSFVIEADAGQPKQFRLEQNYPNPFNPTTVISYQLPTASEVKLELFDVLGRKVATLVNARQEAGVYAYPLNGAQLSLSSGAYFYRLQAGSFIQIKKMMLVK